MTTTTQNTQITRKHVTPDGKQFDTLAQANDHIRQPLVRAALLQVTSGAQELADFLYEREDDIEAAYEFGKVSRVTKSERKKLEKSLEVVKAIAEPKLKFLQDNITAVLESFRWPAVKRMTPEEIQAGIKTKLTDMADGDVADWMILNRDAILNAYKAGKPKPAGLHPNAGAALAAFQAKKREEKAKALADDIAAGNITPADAEKKTTKSKTKVK